MIKVIGFTDMNVKVEQRYSTEWTAVEEKSDSPVGYGSTMIEAIVDLNEKLGEE